MRVRPLFLTVFLLAAACGRSGAAGESLTPQASPTIEASSLTVTSQVPTPAPDDPSPTAAPESPSPTSGSEDPWLAVLDHYPAEDETGVSTHTTLQFVVYRPMPVMRLSLSPEVPLEQVPFTQIERRDPAAGEGEMYLYQPQSPLAPNTTYQATLEIGYTDGTGQEHRATRVWHFTTSAAPQHDYTNQIVLPLMPAHAEGFGALTAGELVIDGPCLYLVHEDGSRTLPIFEEGTVWWEGDTFFYHGNRYEVGDTVAMGGGEVPLDSRTLIQEPDKSCDTGSVWISNG